MSGQTVMIQLVVIYPLTRLNYSRRSTEIVGFCFIAPQKCAISKKQNKSVVASIAPQLNVFETSQRFSAMIKIIQILFLSGPERIQLAQWLNGHDD